MENEATTSPEAQEALQQLTARLADPKVSAGLNELLDHAELLGFLATSVSQLLGRSPEILENLSGSLGMLKVGMDASGIDPDEFREIPMKEIVKETPTFARVLPAAAPLARKAVDEDILKVLGESTMFNPEVIDVLTIMTTGLSHAAIEVQENRKLLSPMKLLWRLRDPDLNRALRFFTTMLQAVGQQLDPVTGGFRPRPTTHKGEES